MQNRQKLNEHPLDPAEAISAAYLRGLASLNRLACKRVNKNTKTVYQSIKSQWSIAKQNWYDSVREKSYDFTLITRAEPNIRKMYLRMLFENTARYGNTLFRRVYDNLGDNDPLNSLLNNAGSMMRDFSGKYYPFPRPVKIGNKQGYIHKKYGMILIGHANIPSLDFIDMIRAHVVELCKHLFIHNVPIKESRKYILRLLYGMVPYLDWAYVGGKRGKNSRGNLDKRIDRRFNNFTDMDKVLSKVISTINDRIVFSSSTIKKDDNLSENRIKIVKHMQSISPRSISQVVNTDFFNHTYDLLIDKKKRMGSIMHKQVLAGIPQPYRLRDVIFSHSSYLPMLRYKNKSFQSKYLVVAELPLQGGRKRPDIVVFTKNHSNRGLLWRPVMVLDIKVKQVFNWTIRKNPHNSMPQSVITPRDFDDDEWEDFVSQAMNNEVRTQLNTYAAILEKSYRRYESKFRHQIITGVLAVDHRIKELGSVHSLIYSAVHHLQDIVVEINQIVDRTEYDENKKAIIKNPVVELSLTDDKSLSAIILDNKKIDAGIFNPGYDLSVRPKVVTGDAKFKLFISVASDINYGNIAAWISGHSNLIDILKKQYDGDIYILDMVNMLSNFSKERLRIKNIDRLIIISKISEIKQSPVIITGWSDMRQMGGPAFKIKNKLLKDLGEYDIFLMDTARKDEKTSKIYRMRRVFPYSKYYPEKPSEIIWDLPLSPRKSIAPRYDNLRVIIRERLSKYDADLLEIDGLRHIARHFSQNRRTRSSKFIGNSVKLKKLNKRDRLKLKDNSIFDAYDLLAHHNNQDNNIIELNDIRVYAVSRSDYNYGIRYTRGRYRDIKKEFKSRRGYQSRYRSISYSTRPPDPKEFEYSFEYINLNKYVGYHILDHHWKKELWDFALYLTKSDPYNTDSSKYNELEKEFKIIQLTLDDKWSFYIDHAVKISFSEFKLHSLWLDLIILSIKLSHPQMVDYQLRYLWRYYSSWLLLSAGYSYGGPSRLNIQNLIDQLNQIIRNRFVGELKHLDVYTGHMIELKNHTYFNFNADFEGFVYKLSFNRFLNIKHDPDLYRRLGKQERKQVKITRYGDDEYLWIFEDKWEIFARIRYNPHSFIKLSVTILDHVSSQKPVSMREETQKKIKNEYDVSTRLELIESEIWMKFMDGEDELDIPWSYYDLSELLYDLNKKEIQVEYESRLVTIRWGRYDVYWGNLTIIKALIYKHDKSGIESPEDIDTIVEQLLMEGETLNCKLKHNDKLCGLSGRDYRMVPKSKDDRSAGFWFHYDCWELECEGMNIKNELGLHNQRGLYGSDVNYLYNTGYFVANDNKYNLKISVEGDDAIYKENKGTLWTLRGIRNDEWNEIKQLPVLSHTRPDDYKLYKLSFGGGTLSFYFVSNRDGSHIMKQESASSDSVCRIYKFYNSKLNQIEKRSDYFGFTMVQEGLSDKFQSAYDACQEHFDECGCDDNENLLYDYVGRDEKESETGVTYSISLQVPGSIIGKVPSISYDWAELYDEVESWYKSYIEMVKEASDISDFNDKVINHGFNLFLTNRKSVYSDSITAGKFTHFAGRSIGLLGERGYDVNKLNELYEELERLEEELPW